ncbi:hypothetical protein DL771_006640 [Monosporascus sp. 5C6A]|nr:hypothetical protein DL771_006640 [Monosporascus sp. 5C6A]
MMSGADSIYSEKLDATKREIRLLQIRPDVNNCSTAWSMSTASLGTTPNAAARFNALSYVWGNTHASQPVRINSQNLRVTENLGQALRGLRNAFIPEADDLPLWIDALCINQQDERERNQQVAIMGDIYRRAERVLIWLGDGDIHSDWAFQRFRLPYFRQEVKQLATSKKQSLNLPWNRGGSAGDSARYWHDAFRDISQDPNAVAALDSDGGMPHGSKASAWDSLRRAIQVAGSLYFPFIAAAEFFKQSATEQRDYVYAFRGLLHPAEQAHIPVDYAQPALKIFHDAMVVFWLSPLDDVQARIIKGFSFHRQSVPDIPSWVPDLSAQKPEDLEGSSAGTDADSGPETEGGARKDPNLKRLYENLYRRVNHRRIFTTSAGLEWALGEGGLREVTELPVFHDNEFCFENENRAEAIRGLLATVRTSFTKGELSKHSNFTILEDTETQKTVEFSVDSLRERKWSKDMRANMTKSFWLDHDREGRSRIRAEAKHPPGELLPSISEIAEENHSFEFDHFSQHIKAWKAAADPAIYAPVKKDVFVLLDRNGDPILCSVSRPFQRPFGEATVRKVVDAVKKWSELPPLPEPNTARHMVGELIRRHHPELDMEKATTAEELIQRPMCVVHYGTWAMKGHMDSKNVYLTAETRMMRGVGPEAEANYAAEAMPRFKRGVPRSIVRGLPVHIPRHRAKGARGLRGNI